jgi:hypothetical protein
MRWERERGQEVKEGRIAERREERTSEGLWPKELKGKRHGPFLFA